MHKRQTNPRRKIHYSFLKILTGSDLSRRRLPFMSICHQLPGPTVWLTACMHGDEVGGVVVIQELFKQLRHRLCRGVVNAFPLMNPIGFETASRNITFSREDLNRSFPGNPHGSLGERIAHTVFDRIVRSSPDLLLDLHNDWRKSIPYVLLDRKSSGISKQVHEKTKAACRKTGFCIIEDDIEIRSSLTHNLLLKGIPSLTFELGESDVVNEKIIKYGVDSILNLLADLAMIDPPETTFTYPLAQAFANGRILKYSDQPFCTSSGIIRFLVKPGDLVKSAQPIARVYNAFGKRLETITALKDAVVLGHADSAAAFPGMHVMAFGEA